ncbi:phasin family protein [Paraburkholderia elongata]|uniref:TIGR01841 family phasin n=1 Tax=Paraburkholderia elongata TaxID=2675747 RepID=A0A972P3C3_9BURK|nr:phasin family protein [Paraburkholderia elongata]NPT62360.1 TIGR01841 family phasin [Paraburkholderia elongata]
MSILSIEQIAAIQKTNVDTLFSLTSKAFEGLEKVVALNLQVIKSSLSESEERTRKALSAKDPQELFSLQANSQSGIEKIQSYSRHLFDIASATQAEFAKIAAAQYEAQNHRVQTLIDDAAKNGPAGSEAAVAALKSAITATNTLYETLNRTARQVVETGESNFSAATTAVSKATRQAYGQASRTATR